jgi:large subunit ribosomal protein L32e
MPSVLLPCNLSDI